jgi:hypothetical protein
VGDAFGFSSAEFETVDDAGGATENLDSHGCTEGDVAGWPVHSEHLAPYDFSDQRKARYDALPDDIRECLGVLQDYWIKHSDSDWDHWPMATDEECANEAAVIQLLDHLGAL